MIRGEARELVMKLIFQMDAQNDFSDQLRDKFFADNLSDDSQSEYINLLTSNIINKLTLIDETIKKYSENWKLERLAKVDLSITRVAIGEILFMIDVPNPVAINEAVNMAKKYSTEESGKYINGILGKIEKETHGV